VHPETALWVDGRLFVSDIGEFNKRDGKVYVRKERPEGLGILWGISLCCGCG